MSDDKKAAASTEQPVATKGETTSVTSFFKQVPDDGCMLVKIYTPFTTFFEGNAHSVTAVNETGRFDVLPGHHNFITMLKSGDVVVEKTDKEQQAIPIARGLMHVRDNRLIVFLDI